MTDTTENTDNYAGPPRESSIIAINVCWEKCFDFSGRSSRSEYWLFSASVAMIWILFSYVVGNLWGSPADKYAEMVVDIVFFIPLLAVGARRLHDIDHSGWWQTIIVMPMLPHQFLTDEYWIYIESTYPQLNEISPFILLVIWLFMMGGLATGVLWLYWFTKKPDPAKNRYN